MNIIRKSRPEDFDRIKQLIGNAGLKTSGIQEDLENFLIMERETGETMDGLDSLIAIVGFELQNQHGLLRSFVFNEKTNQFNIVELMRAVFDYSKEKYIKKLYLCTKQQSSVHLFHMLGFTRAEETPLEVQNFSHFQNISSEQPIIMYYTF